VALSRSLRFLLCGAILILAFADRSHAQGQESTIFPGTGHTYLVDFSAFRVELVFTSATSLTYTGISPDGTRRGSETVEIHTEEITTNVFLVTWQESDRTTVVHVEDYNKRTIVTNITNPDLTFKSRSGNFLNRMNRM